MRPCNQVDDATHVIAHLELGHIYRQQGDYSQTLYHYEYAAHHGGGRNGLDPKVPRFKSAAGDVYDDDARLGLAVCYSLGREGGIVRSSHESCLSSSVASLACLVAIGSMTDGLIFGVGR